LTKGEKNLRATCFAWYSEKQAPAKIPSTALGSPMLLVDLSNWTIKWNTTVANDKTILNKAWSLDISEYSDELEA
jgi:hypothetical protein